MMYRVSQVCNRSPSPSPSPSPPSPLPCSTVRCQKTISSLRVLPENLAVKSRSSCPPFLHCLSQRSHISFLSALPRRPVSVKALWHVVSAAASNLDDEQTKRNQVSKRLETIGQYFKRLGTLSFWGQLVCTVVSAAILAFSVVINGTPTAQATFYLTAGGITAAFVSTFCAFGYIRLSERLRSTAHDLSKAPPRAEVVNQLKNAVIINLLGMGLTLLGMEATVGALVAKSLTSSAGPSFQGGIPTGYNPVLALDVFLVQASANTVVSHFLGLATSLELLRDVNKSPPPESVLKPA